MGNTLNKIFFIIFMQWTCIFYKKIPVSYLYTLYALYVMQKSVLQPYFFLQIRCLHVHSVRKVGTFFFEFQNAACSPNDWIFIDPWVRINYSESMLRSETHRKKCANLSVSCTCTTYSSKTNFIKLIKQRKLSPISTSYTFAHNKRNKKFGIKNKQPIRNRTHQNTRFLIGWNRLFIIPNSLFLLLCAES